MHDMQEDGRGLKGELHMPMIDMPLDELRQYKGISPCPKDIDAFWDEAVREMKSIEPRAQLLPGDFICGFAD